MSDDAPVFVEVLAEGGELWYGQLLLTCRVQYINGWLPVAFVRWLWTVEDHAQSEGRALTARETYGPFQHYRWAKYAGSFRSGHPPGGGAHFGVVSCEAVRGRSPMLRTMAEGDGDNPLFRLVHDMYRFSPRLRSGA